MSHIKVKVRPNQMVRFPGICAHCACPATDSIQLKKRMGRVTRLIQVPLCSACAQTLQRRSADEERWQKIGWLVSGVVGLLVLALGLLLTPVAWGMGLRLLLAVAVSGVVVTAVFTLIRSQQQRVMLPEKQAIRSAARIATFSWRATTFDFENETFTERFKIINESLLMENESS